MPVKASADEINETRDEFLTTRQLSVILQVSESTVRRLAREGRIPVVRLTPRLARFHLPAVREALNGTHRHNSRLPRRQTDTSAEEQLAFWKLSGARSE